MEERVYTLAYAHDLILLSEEKERMRSMMAKLEEYLRVKGLTVNVGKSKILRFENGRKRRRRVRWYWEGRVVGEVKTFKHLGYMFQRNGRQEEQIKDRIKRGAAVIGKIGKRRFGEDWGKRLRLFDALVSTMVSYGVEI